MCKVHIRLKKMSQEFPNVRREEGYEMSLLTPGQTQNEDTEETHLG